LLLLNQVAALVLKRLVGSYSIPNVKAEVPTIESTTSCLLIRHTNRSANDSIENENLIVSSSAYGTALHLKSYFN